MSELKFHPFKPRKARRIWRKTKAFHILVRENITYYVNANYILLNPEHLEHGSGIVLVKPFLENEVTGIYFTARPLPTPDEEWEAAFAYLYEVGEPRKGYAVVPATLFPDMYEHSEENLKALREAGDFLAAN